jgi:hypothetical protein
LGKSFIRLPEFAFLKRRLSVNSPKFSKPYEHWTDRRNRLWEINGVGLLHEGGGRGH